MTVKKYVFNVYNNGGKLIAQREAYGADAKDAEKTLRKINGENSDFVHYLIVGEA